MRPTGFRLLLSGCAVTYAAFLLVPLAALLLRASPTVLLSQLSNPVVWSAIGVSLTTATVATVLTVLGGLPLAWLLVQSRSRWSRLAATVLELPLVAPPSVVGLALLLAFGRLQGLGSLLARLGWGPFAFTRTGVVMAQMLVAAPLFLRAAQTALRAVPPRYLHASTVLGASEARTFTGVVLPLASHGLWGGALLTWARALGELGATLMFAGSLRGVTQTMPTAIFAAWSDDLTAAITLAVCLLLLSLAALWGARGLLGERGR